MDLMDLAAAIRDGRVYITKHARNAADDDELRLRDILVSITEGCVIDRYPDDKPYPSCLVLSQMLASTPIHTVWAYNSASRSAVLVTVYRPDPTRWINWIKRVKS